jgi:hypothetical protein
MTILQDNSGIALPEDGFIFDDLDGGYRIEDAIVR